MYRNRRFGNDRGGRSFAPINIGDEIDVTIEAQGEKGDGLAKVKGFVIFVPGAKQGERVKVRISKVLKKVGFGEVIGKSGEASESKRSSEESSEESEKTEISESEDTEENQNYDESEDSEDFGEEL